MNHLKNLAIKASAATAVMAALPVAKAFAIDYSTDYSTSTVSTTAGTGIAIGLLIFFIIAAIVGLLFFIFWIMMLIDAAKRTNWETENDKTLWLVILIVGFFFGLGWLAALIYYFVIKKKLDKGSSTPAAPAKPASK